MKSLMFKSDYDRMFRRNKKKPNYPTGGYKLKAGKVIE